MVVVVVASVTVAAEVEGAGSSSGLRRRYVRNDSNVAEEDF